MNPKKLFRGPIPYIVLAGIIVWIGLSVFNLSGGYKEISTQKGLELLADGKVQSAEIIDGNQRVDLVLNAADGDNGTRVQFYYVSQRGADVVKAVDSADITKDFNDKVPQPSIWGSLLSFLIPVLLIGALFWFMLAGM